MLTYDAIQLRLDMLVREFGKDHALARLRSYRNRLPAVLADLRDAVDEQDRAAVRVVARALQEGSESLGARRVSLMAQILEGWASVRSWADVHDTLLQVENEAAALTPALARMELELAATDDPAA